MKIIRVFWILFAVAVIFAGSIYFAKKRIETLRASQEQRVVVIDSPSPEPSVAKTNDSGAKNTDDLKGPSETAGCAIQAEFKKLKSELGKIVNSDIDQHHNPAFPALIDKFRLTNGIPLPISVGNDKLNQENLVHNNCRSTCNGSVREVFVSQVVGGRSIQVLQKNGTLKKLPLHESGLELASVDELNKKGVPFRSWLAPVSANDWYIKGNDLYYSLDISGLWLKIDPTSHWEVIDTPADLTKLKAVDEPLKIPGCNNDEHCFESDGRHFKAPRICKGQ
jgi:hypothetical protein